VSPNDKNLKRQHSHRSAAITTYTIQMLDRSTSAITSVTKTRGLDANHLCEICLLKDTVHHICEKVIFSYMIASKFQTLLHIYLSTALSKNITYRVFGHRLIFQKYIKIIKLKKKLRFGNRIRADPTPETRCFIQLLLLLNPRRRTRSTKFAFIGVSYLPRCLIDNVTKKKNPDFKRHGKMYSGCGTVNHTRGTRTSESQIGMLGRQVIRTGKLVARELCGHHLCD